jgi:hypothetical protein
MSKATSGRQHNSEDDEHNQGTSDFKILVAQKDREGAAIKEQAGDQNEIARGRLGADCNVLHLCVLDATEPRRGFR